MKYRVDNPTKEEALRKRRRAQIELAYKSRLKRKMTKAARAALEKERTRQLALARSEFERLSHAKANKKAGYREPKVVVGIGVVGGKFTMRAIPDPPRPKMRKPPGGHIPIGGMPHLVDKKKRKPERQRRLEPVTQHWEFYRGDTPVDPWILETGPGTRQDYGDDDDDIESEDKRFADENYSYEDFETDWGGYEHSDTGYADENA